MKLLHYLRRLYSLDTLDTRFTTSARTPPQPGTSDIRSRIDSAKSSPLGKDSNVAPENRDGLAAGARGASPSRWGTPEFFVYYLIFILVVPMMFKVAFDVSKRELTLLLVPISNLWLSDRAD